MLDPLALNQRKTTEESRSGTARRVGSVIPLIAQDINLERFSLLAIEPIAGLGAPWNQLKGIPAATVKRESERIYDEYLVAAAVTGDREALARLVSRWQPRLLRHAWRVLGDPERAKDAVQEAWMEILRGLARLNDVAAFPAWAYRIVTRRCQRAFRRAGQAAVELGDMEDEHVHAPEHESGEFAAELSTVMGAIAGLPAAQRAALALFYIEDLSVAEIAIALDVPPGTVKTRLMHARRKVRALLGDCHEQD